MAKLKKNVKSVRRRYTAAKSVPPVPAGSYLGTLVRFEEERSKSFGKMQLKATFKLESPKKFAGRELSRWVNLENDAGQPITMTEKSGLYKLFRSLNGGKLEIDDEVDIADFVGGEYTLIVAETDSGFSKIETILADGAVATDDEVDGVYEEEIEEEDDEEEEVEPRARKTTAKKKKIKATRIRSREETIDADDIPFDEPEPDDDEEE